MKQILSATLLGGFLGIFDGLTAWFTPEVRAQMLGIVIGSTIKGLLTGVIIGVFARKVHSLALGMIFGGGSGFWEWGGGFFFGGRVALCASPARTGLG